MKFIKTSLPDRWDSPQGYFIRRTASRYYVYCLLRYVGARDEFDEAVVLARKDASK